ncbi:MAG: Hsp20/alpha crystallin family protein [Dethiobacteria bacterium]|jgi:HSP20 family protein
MATLIPFNSNLGIGMPGFGNLYNMLDDFFSDTWTKRSQAKGTFRVDVRDNEKDYLIEAELPGVNKEEVDIELDEGRLTISVNREQNIQEEKENYLHRERFFSSMKRSIYLADARVEGIGAKMQDGVLSIHIPKNVEDNHAVKINIE